MASTKSLTGSEVWVSSSPELLSPNPGQDFMQFVKPNVFLSLVPFLKTPHVWMKMAAKVEFHSGLDEVREHLHSLDPLFFLPLVRDMKRNHSA